MNKFLIVDTRLPFFQDMSTRINIEDDRDLEAEVMLYSNNNDELHNRIIKGGYDAVVISSVIMENSDFILPRDVTVLGYLERKDDSDEIFTKNGINNIGFFKKSNNMLDYLEDLDLSSIKTTTVNNSTNIIVEKEENKPEDLAQPESQNIVPEVKEQTVTDHVSPNNSNTVFCKNCGKELSPETKFCPSCGTKVVSDTDVSLAEKVRENAIERDTDPEETANKVELDTARRKHKCEIVTVYAAKGGVGKTTISTSIAVLLAMTSTDRRRTKVCIVDYNIDFGDVRPTLGFSSKGVNLMTWAKDIDYRIEEEGADPETLNYTQEEIETKFLQKKVFNKMVYGQNVELYGLIAPIAHEDSMDVSGNAIDVMIRNLKENGDFDYIICDTGNNTRDSTFTALEEADKILLINTQDVTTVSCNDSFIKTMEQFEDFDMSKIYLVINRIVPAKSTGVSVKDIEETVPFPCIARIRSNDNVTLANNKGVPIVFDSGIQFTKEISNIVSIIAKEELTLQPKKKGLFSFLKK